VGIIEPDAVSLFQIVLLQIGKEIIHRASAGDVRVPIPGPVERMARYQPPRQQESKDRPAGGVENDAIASFARGVVLRGIEQGHWDSASSPAYPTPQPQPPHAKGHAPGFSFGVQNPDILSRGDMKASPSFRHRPHVRGSPPDLDLLLLAAASTLPGYTSSAPFPGAVPAPVQ